LTNGNLALGPVALECPAPIELRLPDRQREGLPARCRPDRRSL